MIEEKKNSPGNVRTGFLFNPDASGLRAAERLKRESDWIIIIITLKKPIHLHLNKSGVSPEDGDVSVVVSSRQESSAGRETLRENWHVEALQAQSQVY